MDFGSKKLNFWDVDDFAEFVVEELAGVVFADGEDVVEDAEGDGAELAFVADHADVANGVVAQDEGVADIGINGIDGEGGADGGHRLAKHILTGFLVHLGIDDAREDTLDGGAMLLAAGARGYQRKAEDCEHD